MKKAALLLMAVILIAGCSVNRWDNAAAETEAVKELGFEREGVNSIKEGNMYTYSYFYTNEDMSKTQGKVFILKVENSFETDEIGKIADGILIKEHEYVVIDYRNHPDANMQVRNSHKATYEAERQCVISILADYEERDPSLWERSVLSMKNEWFWHNSAYEADYESERAKHVDLNNKDEENYPTINPFEKIKINE